MVQLRFYFIYLVFIQICTGKMSEVDIFFLFPPNNNISFELVGLLDCWVRRYHYCVTSLGPSWDDIMDKKELSLVLKRSSAAKVVICLFSDKDIIEKESQPKKQYEGLKEIFDFGTPCKREYCSVDNKDEKKSPVEQVFRRFVEAAWFECCSRSLPFIPVTIGNVQVPNFLKGLRVASLDSFDSNIPFEQWSVESQREWHCLMNTLAHHLSFSYPSNF